MTGRFKDGQPAVLRNGYGKGQTLYIAPVRQSPYGKEARFVPLELAEKWPEGPRASHGVRDGFWRMDMMNPAISAGSGALNSTRIPVVG